MYTILLLLLGLTTFMSGLVSAQNNVLGIPDCAVPCFTEAIGNSTCGITDAYCQCTSGAAKIQSVAISCLCHSSCSTADLIAVVQDSNSICSSALAASSQTFAPMTVGLSACATGAAAGSGSGSSSGKAASASATPTGTAASGRNGGSTGSASAASSPAASTGGAGSMRVVGYEGAVLGFGALAALVV